VGQQMKVTVLREGKKQDLTIKIASQEEGSKALRTSVKERLGVEVRPPTERETEKYGLNANQGVVISWLDPKSPLKKSGFEVGDMILGIEGQPVENVEGFIELVSSLKPKQKVSILVRDFRTGNTETVSVVLG
jgi:serine protease Do